MSIKNWPGGRISATPPTPSGPFQDSTASGVWTLEQQAYWEAQNLWPTAGNVNPDLFIENLFQTWLYTGNGSTQTITNGIDLAGKGGLTLFKIRNTTYDWQAFDTARGPTKFLTTNGGGSEQTNANSLTAFNSNGFTLGNAWTNDSGAPYASWTFREQSKFFDVVTYTGNGSASQTVNHNLGSAPGCMFVKAFSTSGNWFVYHTSLGNTGDIFLNSTAAARTGVVTWNSSTPTSTQFQITSAAGLNTNGVTYVAYLFAHNAGGFGLTGTDNVISCGSFTTGTNRNFSVNLGYEPQWLLVKRTNSDEDWVVIDNMRAWSMTGFNLLYPNSSSSETNNIAPFLVTPTATGFEQTGTSGAFNGTYIYIAIRRGPMRTPTTGTSVFAASYGNNIAAAGTIISSNTLVDMYVQKGFSSGSSGFVQDRLRGAPQYLQTNTTDAELSAADWRLDQNRGVGYATARNLTTRIGWLFSRAPGFFDEVCYTGTGSATTFAHNLGVVPEMMIVKNRISNVWDWQVYHGALGNTKAVFLDLTSAAQTISSWSNTTPTSSVFTVGTSSSVNGSTETYVNYLFASCPGVSKVGSFTGTGATQVINCGFTTGARFVLIKATSTTGDWYVWDSTRGIVAGNDPYLVLNNTDADVTTTDWVDTAASGFELSNAGGNLANSNGVSYIFLAIS